MIDALAEAAWREYKIAAGLRGMVDDVHDTPEPPRWFQVEELGLGAGRDGSLHETCAALATTNRRAVLLLGEDAPARVTWPRDFALGESKWRPLARAEVTFVDVVERVVAVLSGVVDGSTVLRSS